ncbi:1,4-alpha-glucan branching protein [Streptomyces sp. NPDC052693]|uniref:maltokinase N-terminal cap-like domain-containing protein n=1 Tax=Streptomyces sp. NPDC052693 TaxID=3155814 RepID=UPI00342FC12C
MAVIHRTTLAPTKLELLAAWLPSRPWYRAGAVRPRPAKAGGFRLDDPQGEVGIEFIIVTDADADADGPRSTAYLVPLTYRGAPLQGAEHALVGTMEHGVLGRRWAYDGCHDPVLLAQLPALIEGRARAQDQNVSDLPDDDVTVSRTGDGPLPRNFTTVDDRDGTRLVSPDGPVLRLHRLLEPAPDGRPATAGGATGHLAGSWTLPDGTRVRGLLASLHD